MNSIASDLLADEAWCGLAGSPLLLIDAHAPEAHEPGVGVRVAVDRKGALPPINPIHFDAMVTVANNAGRPWVSVAPARLDAQLGAIASIAAQAPIAAALLSRVLRLQQGLNFEAALEVESLAYSVLLGGAEFRRWLEHSSPTSIGRQGADPVKYEREGNQVTLTLNSPANRNAMTAAMRDALYEALVNVLEDPSEPFVTVRGEGRCFSTGGDLAEFGITRDLATAHAIRTQRSGARLLHRLGKRAEVRLHGACIGAGIEVPAAASRRIGAPNTLIHLPELRMGLIPGAGGTASLGHTIGRHRLMWLCLGAFRIGAERALDWGLLNSIEA